ncbi:arabinosyltransferase domain-containing protein [Pseudonocardia lacus]|uniref:arabinosyltransferase domain-containing protein n=1 Tax=Pseudonocardia lacus TaxID=2835865 RepID=UPI0027E2AE6A|nr:arabinosyltransferase domain-containing protein [Pseudonocardia lacus]
MLSPARPATRSEPDDRSDPPAGAPASGRGRRWVLVLGLIAALASVAFPLAPVQQPEVSYAWSADDGPAAIPLMPYQPVGLAVDTNCSAVREAGDGVLLSTVPLNPDPTAEPLHGLRLTGTAPVPGPGPGRPTEGGGLRVSSAGVDLGEVALPAGECALRVVSDPTRTAVLVDDAPVLTRDGDVRPDVAGAFSELPDGVDLRLTADTRFQTTISPVKAALAVVAVLALLGMLVAVRATDRAATARVRLLPRRWWLPRPTDVVVTAVLGVWWVVGAITVDDGYIAGIVRGRGDNGFVGNVYRWLNAPEAPFSWFYDLYAGWSTISPSTAWMRLPSVLLGLLCWALLSRLVLPRLGRFATRGWMRWVAALGLLTWWVPLNVGLRPEPWVAVGALVAFLAVERAVATRALLPLALGLVVAGATTAVTPGGLMAFVPFLVAAAPVLRVLRARAADLRLWPLLALLVAAPASAVLLMVSDQSLAGMLEATRVRTVIGGGLEWYEEYERYSTLLEPASFQGSIGRRAAVLVTLLAAVGVLWSLRRAGTGIATGPARRLAAGFLAMLAVMTLSPTKWTQHFGDVAGYGAAVLVLGAAAWSARVVRPRPAALAGGLAAATAVCSLVLAGYNLWPFAGDWFTPTFSTLPPQVGGTPLATIVAVLGGLLVAVLLARTAWRRSAPAGGGPDPAVGRWVPGPVPIVALVLVGVLALQVGSFARIAAGHRDSYTLASDALATVRGEPCGLQRLLSVETDPAAGLLPTEDGAVPAPRTLPVDVGGALMPGIAVAGRTASAWFTLDPQQRDGRLPVVVTTSGTTRPGDALSLEFRTGDTVERRGVATEGAEPSDHRELAPAGADAVRLVVDAPTAGPRSPAVVSLPRVPRLTPMSELIPASEAAVLDWPVAFLFPCVRPAALPDGTAQVPGWRIGPPAADPAAGITYSPGFGGPFAAPRLLVTEQRMPTYLTGAPLRDAVQVYRWTPSERLATPRPTVVERTVSGWHRDGHARVPGLDPVG